MAFKMILRRIVASAIDTLLIGTVLALINFTITGPYASAIAMLIGMVATVTYYFVLETRGQRASLGKRWLGLSVYYLRPEKIKSDGLLRAFVYNILFSGNLQSFTEYFRWPGWVVILASAPALFIFLYNIVVLIRTDRRFLFHDWISHTYVSTAEHALTFATRPPALLGRGTVMGLLAFALFLAVGFELGSGNQSLTEYPRDRHLAAIESHIRTDLNIESHLSWDTISKDGRREMYLDIVVSVPKKSAEEQGYARLVAETALKGFQFPEGYDKVGMNVKMAHLLYSKTFEFVVENVDGQIQIK